MVVLKIVRSAVAIVTIESPNGDQNLVWKYPSREITLGSQIIVNESEEALIYENGQLLQILQPGRHTVETGNIPGIEGLIKRSFSNKSPIIVEIWFVTKTASPSYKWGFQTQVRDKIHELIVPLGSYGSLLLRIEDSSSLVLQIVGKNSSMTKEGLKSFLIPIIERNVKNYIANSVIQKNIDIFTIDSYLGEASESVKESLDQDFARFGVKLMDFYIQGMEVIGDNPEYLKIKETLAEAASLRIKAKAANESKGFYQQERSLDVLDKAVEQKGGLAGNLLAGGLGVGLGINAAQKMASSITDSMTEPTKETISARNQSPSQGSTDLKQKLTALKEFFDSGLISKDEYEEKKKDLLNNL
ncbi:SPFH domain-containing protein [Prochlorococcus sp. MIT 1300]|uniref:SPFH domain-containing protein n=1 Tax=Prochlorococcus sp. MIT 1300 TaxID=3096218 RepID=UPI002A75E704|nr:SPFH domain-containing protein [Prochlorococcus sp. MIT 1300]